MSNGRSYRLTTRPILITGSIARSASRRYLVYSEADFEVFRPTGATRCTDGVEIWHGGGDQRSRPPPPRQISPPPVQRLGYRTPKTDFFLLRFDQNVEYKRPAGAHLLRDLHKICRICTPFQDALAVKKFVGFAQGVMELWGF